jgi:hypothetical protein
MRRDSASVLDSAVPALQHRLGGDAAALDAAACNVRTRHAWCRRSRRCAVNFGDLLGLRSAPASQAAPRSCLRLRGGGGDGGATGAESRSSYLEMYKTQKTGEVRVRVCQAPGWRRTLLTRCAARASWTHARSSWRRGRAAA